MSRRWLTGTVLVLALLGGIAALCAAEEPVERNDVLYVCGCEAGCTCNSVSTEPGNCSCGKPMKWHHVVKVEGSEALLCTCGEGCTCAIRNNFV